MFVSIRNRCQCLVSLIECCNCLTVRAVLTADQAASSYLKLFNIILARLMLFISVHSVWLCVVKQCGEYLGGGSIYKTVCDLCVYYIYIYIYIYQRFAYIVVLFERFQALFSYFICLFISPIVYAFACLLTNRTAEIQNTTINAMD